MSSLERRGPAAEPLHTGQVVPVHRGMPGQGEHDRRDHDRLGDAVVLQRGQEPGHVEPGQRNQGRTAGQGPAREHDQPDGVEERRHR